MKKAVLVILSVVALGMGSALRAQLTAEEQAAYDKWEDFLKTAKVVAQEQITGALAVTNPWVLTLEKDGVRHKAVWKNIFGERIGGFKETWKGRDRGLPAQPGPGPEHGPGDGRAGVPGGPGLLPDLVRGLEHHGVDHREKAQPAGHQGPV